MIVRRFTLLLMLLFSTAYAQHARVDSLLNALENAVDEQQRADIFNGLSAASLHFHADSALGYARKAMDLSRKLSYTKGQAQARLNQAHAMVEAGHLQNAAATLRLSRLDFEKMGDISGIGSTFLAEALVDLQKADFNAALLHCHAADSIFLTGNMHLNMADAHITRGIIFEALGSYDLAYENFQHAVEIQDSFGSVNARAHARDRLADALEDMDEHAQAIRLHTEALETHRAKEDFYGEMLTLGKLARLHLKLGDTETARKHALRARRMAFTLDAEHGYATMLQLLGDIDLKDSRMDSARKHYQTALAFWKRTELDREQAETRLGLIRVYNRTGQFGPAIRDGEPLLEFADSIGDLETLAQTHEQISRAYQGFSDYRNALKYHQFEVEVGERIRMRDSERKHVEMRVRLEHEKAVAALQLGKTEVEAELKREKEILQREEWMLYGAIIFGVLLLFFSIFLIRANRKSKRDQRLLHQRTEELEESEEEVIRMNTALQKANVNLEELVDERTEALKEAVTSLLEVNEELDNFVYRASHDLLGPIARLKGLVLVAKSSAQKEQIESTIGLIDSVAFYMDRVLRKLILIHDVKHTRGEPDKVDLEQLILDIQPQLTRIPGIQQPEIVMNNHIKRKVNVSTKLTKIVMENLLENACIFRRDKNDRNPRIYVSIHQEQNDIMVELWDEGIGIPDEIQTRVFDIFFRGSERSKGNGLGLYLVKTAVNLLGGRIELESKEGVFTKILVRFPERTN